MESGALGGSAPEQDMTKEKECDTTNGTFADITGAAFSQITTSGATTGAATTLFTVFNRTKRYIQAVGTVVGTTNPSITASVVILEQKKQL